MNPAAPVTEKFHGSLNGESGSLSCRIWFDRLLLPASGVEGVGEIQHECISLAHIAIRMDYTGRNRHEHRVLLADA